MDLASIPGLTGRLEKEKKRIVGFFLSQLMQDDNGEAQEKLRDSISGRSISAQYSKSVFDLIL